jgi:hypothetical protein
MGATTSTLNFMRTIGGVFGVTYLNLLSAHFAKEPKYQGLRGESDAYVYAMLLLVPFGGLSFIFSFFLRQQKLKTEIEFAAPE